MLVENLAQWDGSSWTSLSTDISSWEGPVKTIVVQISVANNDIDSRSFLQGKFLILIFSELS